MRRVRERLTVHVIDGGGEQEHPANPPFPGGGAVHPSHDLPSHFRTRLSSRATSSVKILKSASPFSAEAKWGNPMCPGCVRSCVTHARWAGSKALPNSTGARSL